MTTLLGLIMRAGWIASIILDFGLDDKLKRRVKVVIWIASALLMLSYIWNLNRLSTYEKLEDCLDRSWDTYVEWWVEQTWRFAYDVATCMTNFKADK